MTGRLIENIDKDLWRMFAGYCKIKNRVVGEYLSELIRKELTKRKIMKEEDEEE